MANCMLGFPNQIDAAVLGGGSFVPTMPLTKVQGRKLNDVARTINAQPQNTYITLDQGKPTPARVLALVNHNFSVDAAYRVRATNEQSATNLISASEQLADSPWSNIRCLIFPNSTVAPDGKQTASKLVATTESQVHYIEQYPSFAVGVTHTRSVFLKSGGHNHVRVETYSRPDTNSIAAFNFNTNTGQFSNVLTKGGATQELRAVAYPNGWWRVIQSFTTGTPDPGCYYRIALRNGAGTSTTFAGDGVNGIYVWGMQLEVGATATSYWPTPVNFTSRPSVATYWDSSFLLQTALANVARWSFDPNNTSAPARLLIESAATNVIRNNTLAGAVTGSPGTLPTNWQADIHSSQTVEVQYLSAAASLDYIDLRFQSANSARSYIALHLELPNGSGIAALPGQIWAASVFMKCIAGLLPNNPQMCIRSFNSAGVMVSDFFSPKFDLPEASALLASSRVTHISGPLGDDTTRLGMFIQVLVPVGQPFDFTLRIALPQLERNVVTSPIRTSAGAGTRAAENGSFNRVRPAGYIDEWQPYSYDSAWQDVWPVVYPFGTKEWEDPSWWGGKYSPEEIQGQTASLIHLLPQITLFRYWRIDINDTANPAGYVQLGRMFIGPTWQPRVNMSYGASLALETDTQVQKSLGGGESYDVRKPYRVQRYKLDTLSRDEALSNVFEIQRRAGIDKEVLWISDPADNSNAIRDRFLGRLRTLSPIEYPYYGNNSAPFEIKEIQ